MSGFRDTDFLAAAARAGATVIATHIRRPPGIPDPDPIYADLLGEVTERLAALAEAARQAGIGDDRIVLDPGIDLGKSWQQSLRLVACIGRFATLGLPILVAVSNKIFLRRTLGLDDQPLDIATAAATAVGVFGGGHVLRVHDARIGRQAGDLAQALRGARG